MNRAADDEQQQPAGDDRQAAAGVTINLPGGVTLTAGPARKVVIRPDEITLTGYSGDELGAAVDAINRHPVVCASDLGPFTRMHSHALPEVMPLGNGAETSGQVCRG